MQIVLEEVTGYRIDHVTDRGGLADPLGDGQLRPATEGGDIEAIFVDGDRNVFIRSRSLGLVPKRLFEKRWNLRFGISRA